MSGFFHNGEWYENADLWGHPCQEPLYERSGEEGVYYCFGCEAHCRCEVQLEQDPHYFPRVMVARPVDGITLNSALEYVLDDKGQPRVFNNQPEAEGFLLSHGIPADDLEHLYFVECDNEPKE